MSPKLLGEEQNQQYMYGGNNKCHNGDKTDVGIITILFLNISSDTFEIISESL